VRQIDAARSNVPVLAYASPIPPSSTPSRGRKMDIPRAMASRRGVRRRQMPPLPRSTGDLFLDLDPERGTGPRRALGARTQQGGSPLWVDALPH